MADGACNWGGSSVHLYPRCTETDWRYDFLQKSMARAHLQEWRAAIAVRVAQQQAGLQRHIPNEAALSQALRKQHVRSRLVSEQQALQAHCAG